MTSDAQEERRSRVRTPVLPQNHPGLRPELAESTEKQLEEFIYWAARSKGLDGLDHGYWHPWAPPCELDHLQGLGKGAVHACFTWILRQLRSHRDAVACLAGNLLKVHLGQPAGEAAAVSAAGSGPRLAEAGLAALTENQARLEAMEEREKVLSHRLDALNQEFLQMAVQGPAAPAQLRKSMTVPARWDDLEPATAARAHEFMSEQALKECRHGVTCMLNMQQSLRTDVNELQQSVRERFEKVHAAVQATAAEASRATAQEADDRKLAIEAMAKPLEERLIVTQQLTMQVSEWKDRKSAVLVDMSERLDEAEEAIKGFQGDVEGLTEDVLQCIRKINLTGTQEPPQGSSSIKPGRSSSISIGRSVNSRSPSIVAKVEFENEVRTALANAEEAASHARKKGEDLRNEVLQTVKALQDNIHDRFEEKMFWFQQKLKDMASQAIKDRKAFVSSAENQQPRPQSPVARDDTIASRNVWPQRNTAFRQGKLPNLPPSSLAQEEVDACTPRSRPGGANAQLAGPCLTGLAGQEVQQEAAAERGERAREAEDVETSANKECQTEHSEEEPDTAVQQQQGQFQQQFQQQQFQQELHSRLNVYPPMEQAAAMPWPEQRQQERYLPPTGGCFNHQGRNSRLGNRSRPTTAEGPRGGRRGHRPSTAGVVQ